MFQVGHVDAGEKFHYVELSFAPVALPAAVIGVDVDFQIDVARLDPPIDKRLAPIVQAAGHAEFQSHSNFYRSLVIFVSSFENWGWSCTISRLTKKPTGDIVLILPLDGEGHR
jgi:hypothetical protein